MYSNSKIKSSYTFHNTVNLLKGGLPYFSTLIELIDNATSSLQMQFYIYEDDATGIDIANHLIQAAKRGVIVQILLDGYASRKLSPNFKKKLRSNGIRLRFFEPILKSKKFYFGRRLHHKIVVADGQRALVGGINISDRYNDTPGQSAWLDWAIYVKGEAAYELYKICDQFYSKNSEENIHLDIETIMKSSDTKTNTPLRIRRNDWVMNKNEISASYMNMFKQAEHSIIIMSSYFIPGAFFKRNIIKALSRGISIKLILAGISDIGIAKYAEKYLYRWALRHGIEIYEYKHNILHGKIAVSDNTFVTVGSYNINDISALASIELNVDIENKDFATSVSRILTNIIENECERVSPLKAIKSFSLLEQVTHWVSYELFRITFTLFTFYFRKYRRQSQLY